MSLPLFLTALTFSIFCYRRDTRRLWFSESYLFPPANVAGSDGSVDTCKGLPWENCLHAARPFVYVTTNLHQLSVFS
jgi:hypothetical protein